MRLQVPERTWLNRPKTKQKEASSGSTTFSVEIAMGAGAGGSLQLLNRVGLCAWTALAHHPFYLIIVLLTTQT